MPRARGRRHALVAGVALLALLGGCARAVSTGPPVTAALGREEVGMASWYGVPHHGRRTASGEVFDMHQLTAAHRTLPFGTRVLVVNRGTNQSAEVRINDRGPFVEGRILDVSYAAARLLGALGPGIIPVRVRVVALPAIRAAAGPDEGNVAVQLGSFTSRARGEALGDPIGADVTTTGATVAGETSTASASALTRTAPGEALDRSRHTRSSR